MSTVPNGNNQMVEQEAAKSDAASKATPITNTTVAPEHKKKKLVRKQVGSNQLKYKAWAAGHISTIVFGVITFFFQDFPLAKQMVHQFDLLQIIVVRINGCIDRYIFT